MTQSMKPDMAIIVTTPQEVSLIDSRRAIAMAREMEISNIGLIENMSGFLCPQCGHRIDLFGVGGGKKQAKELGVKFLGALPINTETRKLADKGKSIVKEDIKADISLATMEIVEKIDEMLSQKALDS